MDLLGKALGSLFAINEFSDDMGVTVYSVCMYMCVCMCKFVHVSEIWCSWV